MTSNGYPDDRDQQALAAAHAALTAAGIAPRESNGYDVGTLAAAVYARGWTYGIDLADGTFRAEIRPQGATTRQPSVLGVGWTADIALAFALAQALLRRDLATRSPDPAATGDGLRA